MKILVVMGSPRKGEGYHAVQQIESQMQAMGDVTFDYLWLKDVNFAPCRGCHACCQLGEQKCPLRDDTAAVEARMLAADGILLVTPVYSLQVSYLMKIFIDRYSYVWHRPRFFGKFAMTVATGGGQFKETLGYMEQVTKAWGYTFVTGVGIIHHKALVPKMLAKQERSLATATRKFFEAVSRGQTPRPSLFQLVWFRMWRINAKSCKKINPADFQYWTERGWMQSDYYTKVSLNPLEKAFGAVMEQVLVRFMRGVYQGY